MNATRLEKPAATSERDLDQLAGEFWTWRVATKPGSPDRVDEDALHYLRELREDLPYSQLAEARDPRTALVHEGVHAHERNEQWNPLRPKS
ncbi:MAG TPA: hypothetical protein VFT31_10600 [Kribbella sp.]|nr:hypothetical protein [Kribbella sp.]